MNLIYKITLILLLAGAIRPCQAQFAKGADVGWLPQMEATGFKFYDSDGKAKDCLLVLKERGSNTIRRGCGSTLPTIEGAAIAAKKRRWRWRNGLRSWACA